MKYRLKIIHACYILAIILLIVSCRQGELIEITGNQVVFIKNNDTLTNGTLNYKHLPEDWYFFGEYPYRIGRIKGGRALFASDENCSFVKENKPLLADMDYSPWMREDYVLPELDNTDLEVSVHIYKRTNEGYVYLDGQAREDCVNWFDSYRNGKSTTAGAVDGKHIGSLKLYYSSIPGLSYVRYFGIYQKKDTVYIVDNNQNIIGIFNKETALFQECRQDVSRD